MTYAFYVRFQLVGSELDVEGDSLPLWSEGGESVWLEANGELRRATSLKLRGAEYESAEAAHQAGERAAAALRLAFIETSTPADFLERQLMGGMSSEALAQHQKAVDESIGQEDGAGSRVLVVPLRSGVQVHLASEEPISIHGSASGIALKSATALANAFATATTAAQPARSASLAFDLWSAAARMPSIDSRFLTLVNAVEALVEQRPTEGAELEVVERLEELVDGSDLEAGSKASFRGRLREFRRESIGRAARRLCRRLDPELYAGKSASAFFSDVYDMRSRLTHGDDRAPSHGEVSEVNAELSRFVEDLIRDRFVRGAD